MKMIKKMILAAAFGTMISLSAFAGGTGKHALAAIPEAKQGPGTAAAGMPEVSISSAPGAAAGQEEQAAQPQEVQPQTVQSQAAQSQAVQSQGLVSAAGLEIERVNVPKDATVLITVEADRNASKGLLTAYVRCLDAEDTCGPFQKVLEAEAMLGMNGLYKEKEGDNRTPVGIFRMNTPFGILPKAEGFPDNYLQVDSRYYWNGDSDSAKYNKLVRTDLYSDFNRRESEHLIDYGGYYDYGLDMGYNPDGTPGKGSALFLHCSVNGQKTHGCVGIPAEQMAAVLRLYQEGHTWIAVCDKSDLTAAYK